MTWYVIEHDGLYLGHGIRWVFELKEAAWFSEKAVAETNAKRLGAEVMTLTLAEL